MVLVNYTTRELTAKLVYYGPGLCGKTTNLQFIYESLLPKDHRGKMVSLSTETDRTLFFDFLPIDLGSIHRLKTRLQLYTVPGQVHYNATRKIVLKGADGIVFVADSQRSAREANLESYKNMKANLAEHGMDLKNISHVFQFNKRDLPDIMPVDQMVEDLNEHNVPFWEAIAIQGIGVEDTLKGITRLVMKSLAQRFTGEAAAELEPTGTLAAPAVPAAATATIRAALPSAPPAAQAPARSRAASKAPTGPALTPFDDLGLETPGVEGGDEVLEIGDAMLIDDEVSATSDDDPFGPSDEVLAPSPRATPFELDAPGDIESLEPPPADVERVAPDIPVAELADFDNAFDPPAGAGASKGAGVGSSSRSSPFDEDVMVSGDTVMSSEGLEGMPVEADLPRAAPPRGALHLDEDVMLSGDTVMSSEGLEGMPVEADLARPLTPASPRGSSPEDEDVMISGDTVMSSEGLEGLPVEADLHRGARAAAPAAPSPQSPLLADELFVQGGRSGVGFGNEAAPVSHAEVVPEVRVPVDLGTLTLGASVVRVVEVPLEMRDAAGVLHRVVLAISLRVEARR